MVNLKKIQERLEIESFINQSKLSETKLFYQNYLNYPNLDNLNALIYRKYTVNREFIKKLFTFIFVSGELSEEFLQSYLDIFFNFINLFDNLKVNMVPLVITKDKLSVDKIRKQKYNKILLDNIIYSFNGFKFFIQGIWKNDYMIKYTVSNSIFSCIDTTKDFLNCVNCERHLPKINIINTIEEAVSCKLFEEPLLNIDTFDPEYFKRNDIF